MHVLVVLRLLAFAQVGPTCGFLTDPTKCIQGTVLADSPVQQSVTSCNHVFYIVQSRAEVGRLKPTIGLTLLWQGSFIMHYASVRVRTPRLT